VAAGQLHLRAAVEEVLAGEGDLEGDLGIRVCHGALTGRCSSGWLLVGRADTRPIRVGRTRTRRSDTGPTRVGRTRTRRAGPRPNRVGRTRTLRMDPGPN